MMSTAAAVAAVLLRFRAGSPAAEEDTSVPSPSSCAGSFSFVSLASLELPKKVEVLVDLVRSMASA
jgi:hypothetical protein